MLEYCRVYTKQIKLLPPESQLSDFHHPSEGKKKKEKKNGELLFVTVGTGLKTYYFNKYVKYMTDKNLTRHTINLIIFGLVVRQ